MRMKPAMKMQKKITQKTNLRRKRRIKLRKNPTKIMQKKILQRTNLKRTKSLKINPK